MRMVLASVACTGAVACAFGTGSAPGVDPANLPAVVTWDDHVGPVMDDVCTSCHGPYRKVEDLDFSLARDVRCDWGEVRELAFSGLHPPGGAPRPDAWALAVLEKWELDGFAVRTGPQGEPVFEDFGCGAVGD